MKSIRTVLKLLESAGLNIELPLQIGVHLSLLPANSVKETRVDDTRGLDVVEGDPGSDCDRE